MQRKKAAGATRTQRKPAAVDTAKDRRVAKNKGGKENRPVDHTTEPPMSLQKKGAGQMKTLGKK